LSPDQSLDIYLIGMKNGKIALFCPPDALEVFEAESDDKVRRALAWVVARPWRVVSWFGRVLQSGHGYYLRFEARLDPLERVLKAMASARRFRVIHSSARTAEEARKQLQAKVRGQGAKHLFWAILDLVLSLGAIALAFIPGPNVVGWYPFLRSLSHYRAFRGTRSGLASSQVEFKCLPALRGLEENLQASSFDRTKVHAVAEDLKISGLQQFLERMV
jgi:hypothetical protein